MYILGLSAYYHDSAAVLLKNNTIVAAAQEERFTRRKHDAAFPGRAIQYCLDEAGITITDLSHVVFYDKPLIKFERLLETYLNYAPKGFRSFLSSMPIWLKDKLYLKTTLYRELAELGSCKKSELPELMFAEHHRSHAASAFFPSPFESAAVMCLDGVGEWATTSVWQGQGNKIRPLWQIDFPHSLGLLYSAFTYYLGFKVNSGEYKMMGLAPYGEPRFETLILENLIDLKDDGTFRLDMRYFNYCTGLTMTNARFDALFGGPPRQAEAEISQREMDIAASIQKVTETTVLRLANSIYEETGENNLCLAGGVALNCVANGRLLRESPFDGIWVQPAAGDAGGALGAAQIARHEYGGHSRTPDSPDSMSGAYLGPRFTEKSVTAQLDKLGAIYTEIEDASLYPTLAELLDNQSIIGWFQGRMEFGPRALGGRSIIGDPRGPEMQSRMNLKIKYRESFRPFAPSVLAEKVGQYFEHETTSPYMTMVANVRPSLRIAPQDDAKRLFGIEKLNVPRSTIPAITHLDYSARIQTVHADTNPRYHALLTAFQKRTGCGVLVNTSFNVRGEPIVCTPEDAYRCFMRTEMDYLVIENCLLDKKAQPVWQGDDAWQDEFEAD
ncbi:MAG: hypothetical protein GKR90_23910 [Pseudomonadales bacterium]|nr:hypothetical protein [Pseudomonadales bacterium]